VTRAMKKALNRIAKRYAWAKSWREAYRHDAGPARIEYQARCSSLAYCWQEMMNSIDGKDYSEVEPRQIRERRKDASS